MIKIHQSSAGRISQGDIYRDIEYIEDVREQGGVIVINKIVFPLVIVLTQDCDLQQDDGYRKVSADSRTEDKFLISVLVAPVYNAEQVYTGEHLSELGRRMQLINKRKTQGKNIQQNENSRYHYLDFPASTRIPASIIDFKHYFSVNVDNLRGVAKEKFVCRVSELFRESISQRFAGFLSRVGLPVENVGGAGQAQM